MTMAELWESLLKRRARKTLDVELPAEGPPNPIESGSGYFQVRLAEMYLRDERWLTQERVPATLFLCEFKYGQQDARIPFFVSNQLLAGVTGAGTTLDKARIRFKDTRVIGPVPYVGNDVSLFTALFRTVIKDNRKVLFSVFEKLSEATGAALGTYVKLADRIIDDVMNSVGMGDVECVLGHSQVLGTATRPLANGYLAMLDCEQADLREGKLSVADGRLHIGDGADARPFDLCDFCLVRIETFETRNDFTTMPFHAKWKEARELLLQGKVPDAKVALLACQAALLRSDDLTEDHKYRLVEFYRAAFYKDQQRFSLEAAPITTVDGPTRGDDALLEIGKLADLARRKPRQIRDSMGKIKELFEAPAIPVRIERASPADDQAWETAIQQHLSEPRPRNDRKAVELLVQTLNGATLPAGGAWGN